MKKFRFGAGILLVLVWFGACQTTENQNSGGAAKEPVQRDDSFDGAIVPASKYLAAKIPENARIAIVRLDARKRISNYIIDTINQYLIDTGRFIVIERGNLEDINTEINYQMSGNVDDNTAALLGRQAGTQYIITGSVSHNPSTRLAVRIHNVETAQILGSSQFPFNQNDEVYKKIDDFILDGNHLFLARTGYVEPKYINDFKKTVSGAKHPLEAYDTVKKYLVQTYESPSLITLDELLDFFAQLGFNSPDFRETLILALDDVRSVFFDYGRSDGKRGYVVVRTY